MDLYCIKTHLSLSLRYHALLLAGPTRGITLTIKYVQLHNIIVLIYQFASLLCHVHSQRAVSMIADGQ